MPATVKVHVHMPTTNREIALKEKIELRGGAKYTLDKAEFTVPLTPGMNHHGFRAKLRPETLKMLQADLQQADPDGEYIHINGEKGIQIKSDGDDGWAGPDGRYYYASKIQKDAQDLQAGREPPKTEKAIIWMGVAIVLLIVALVIVSSMAAGG